MNDVLNILVPSAIVLARFIVPLWIPRFPLPAIIIALVLDGIDGGIYQRFTTLSLESYQSFDKALDIYYLTIAYLSTIRNWTNLFAVKVAAFLLYYRLVGVLLFEITNTRALLFVFPNTFEYFFILYEAARLRWDMARVSRKVVLIAAAAIWIIIKLPQEYWIHIAQRDVTDTLAANPVLIPIIAVALAVIIGAVYWITMNRLDPADHAPSFAGGIDLSASDMRTAMLEYRTLSWRDQGIVEKLVLIALLCANFSIILPGTAFTTTQLVIGISVIVVLNTALSEVLTRRGLVSVHPVWHFATMLVVNLGISTAITLLLPGDQSSVRTGNMLFFFFLVSLLVTMFDRFRAMANMRLESEPTGALT